MPSLVRSRTCYPLGSGFSAQPPRAIVVGIAGTVDDLSKSIRAPRQVGGATPKIVGDKGGAVREFAKTVNETGEAINECAGTVNENAETVSENAETVDENSGKTPEPLTKTPGPLAKMPEPLTKTPEPLTKTPEPLTKTPEPLAKTPGPLTKTPEPLTVFGSGSFCARGSHVGKFCPVRHSPTPTWRRCATR